MTRWIDGKSVARRIQERVAHDIATSFTPDTAPGLATVLVGEDPASAVYVASKRRTVRKLGMRDLHRTVPSSASHEEVATVIDALAQDPSVSGILLQLPLPDGLDAAALIDRIPMVKDVDGLTTLSAGLLARDQFGLRPCTPAGVIELLDSEGVTIDGANAVVVGRSDLVGRPMAQMLMNRDATVTVAHKGTVDLAAVTRAADVLVVATGVRGLIGPEHVKPGATVVDVGIHRTSEGLVGDVRARELVGHAKRLTPVPGGVGPMTIATLMANTVKAAEWARELNHR
ncbi:bifunctional 5,10-methylenetetrahydrofolate dehydrogenase/5,10-methenyltetrahydrofolate cyclohydrolase [Nocardia miyunensis]|uniref:bifunctional 5,10-methylenetetrahydrofolate dehydrogenase/5,10-methenyltetrahydrofolate cyclohydrolase n=1 Tax=Nocardia miyunensis TaxID=282684 RepID=UPI00082B5658|nr:bifunctional 5,10-methylenetetrahydrofolate dehydrogenase/5,10-methenyltetrahydrofolate cyclohydrolase [Nocardia miyunensis]